MKDRELILFPIMAAVVVIVVGGAFLGLAAATGTLDRVNTVASGSSSGEQATIVDAVLGFGMLFVSTFIVLFFNTALIASAMLRLRGGDPDIRYGLRAASSHIPALIGWSLITATVGLILQILRNRTDNIIGRLAIGLVGGVWAYMTFFVIPVIVAEGCGPVEAIKRSGSLFRQTWGRQAVSSFGFGLVYIGAALVAILPAALLFAVAPVLGIVVGVFTFAIAMGAVGALEGIFKAALYDFATGATPEGFDTTTLRSAYRAL